MDGSPFIAIRRFFLNCYHQWSLLVFRNGNGTAHFLHSREDVTQGGPLAMAAYGIGVLPLIKRLKSEHPDVTQTWYADDAGVIGTGSR